jgi:hypothetical protein
MVALIIAAGAAFAYPSLVGPTGGANLPVANVAAEGQWSIAVDYFNQSSDGLGAAMPVRVLYGIGNNFEVGAMYTFQDGDFVSLDVWGLNAKYLTPLTFGGFNWSVGALYEKFNDFDFSAIQGYFVGTRVLSEGTESSPAVRGTVGINWTQVDATFDEVSEKTDAFRPFLDLDVAFKGGANVTAEYQFENDDFDSKALASLVVRYPFTPNWSAQIGLSNAFRGISGGDDYDLLVGVNYKMTSY